MSVIGFIDDPNVETNCDHQEIRPCPRRSPRSRTGSRCTAAITITEKDFIGRDDFRKRNTITIDPTTARDFDDAIDVEVLPDGAFSSEFISPTFRISCAGFRHGHRSALSRNVGLFSRTVCFRCFLKRVSNHLCSLNPQTDRLALSVMMHLSRDGDVRDYSFHNSVIHSKERMTYEDVQKITRRRSNRLEQRYSHVVATRFGR